MKPILLLAILAVTASAADPVRILVAYHSVTGHTEKLAREVRAGAAGVEGVEVTLTRTADFKAADITRFNGILVGGPVHWANMSAETRAFLDRIGDALWKAKANGDGRTAGVFCTGGGEAMGKDVVRLSAIAALMTMRYTIIGGVDAAGFGTLGPQATTGGRQTVADNDLAEARQFGERFARLTRQYVRGQ
jgi:NAD(P)H dehydrogenase (quinone)